MHPAAMEWIARHATKAGRVLDVGGRDVNGSPRHLFGPDYTVLDIAPGPGIDIVADAATMMWTDRPYNVVICAEVLEHALNWRWVVVGCVRMLAPYGRLIITAAGPGRPAHSATNLITMDPGEHYANIDPADLDDLLYDLELSHEVDVAGQDVRAVAYAG